jgi:hypothetical protein
VNVVEETMMNDAIAIIVIMTIITTLLLVGLPVIFPDMIPDNVKKHIEGTMPIETYEMSQVSDGYNR